MSDCADWLHKYMRLGWTLYIKRLSANDTGATKAHQYGLYLTRDLMSHIAPGMYAEKLLNPRRDIDIAFDSPKSTNVTASLIWYNNKVVGDGTRNEFRVTGWGGSESPLLDPEQTGALVVFAFERGIGDINGARVWICDSIEEEDDIEGRLGEIEPGMTVVVHDGVASRQDRKSRCTVDQEPLPEAWINDFPEAAELVELSVKRSGVTMRLTADQRLLGRRTCEYRLFRSLEDILVLPKIRSGFGSVEDFVDLAATVSNRRKSRAGRSLELHLRRIFDECGVHYDHGAVTEGAKRPDFIFPSAAAYRDHRVPTECLRVLAAKTTCKDRWRQVINEADRLRSGWKHLLTMQEGVSEAQFAEMEKEGVRLVVPGRIRRAYPESIRNRLLSLEQFISEVRSLNADQSSTVAGA